MLVHKESKKLILNLRDPARVTTVIPTATTFAHGGHTLVAVPHGEDEVRVLRNLNLDAPAPIESQYDWPCAYPSGPYIHQRVTSAFLTLNPRAYCLNGMGCIAGDDKVRVRRYGKSQEMTLRALYAKYHKLPDKAAWEVRSLRGDVYGLNKLEDVIHKGDQQTLRIVLADGKTLRCTADHRLAQPGGKWIAAGDLRVGDALVTNGERAVVCGSCGESRTVKQFSRRRLAQNCLSCKHSQHSARMKGAHNPSWRGGRFVDGDGYVRLNMPGHGRADNHGYVYEHIAVAEEAYGHPIGRDMHVHHINGDKADNRPENLEVLPAAEHARGHANFKLLDGSVSAKGGVVVALPKASTVQFIGDGGIADVYDLSMQAPHHNFVVNGIVVHNSGKTLSVLWSFDHLRRQGMARRMLVVAPLSTLVRTWSDEIFTHLPHLNAAVLHGTMERRLKLLAVEHDIYLVNHDGVRAKPLLEALSKRDDIDVVVLDEVAVFRTPGTERFKSAVKLVQDRRYVWGLTGTPTPNAPTDAWAQCRIVTPGSVPKYFGMFRDITMKQLTQYKWGPRESALETVRAAMQPSVRFSREDCIDLPPTTHQTRTVDLTSEQKTAYNDMLKRLKAEYAGGQVLAVNEAVKLGKLLQICCGVAYGLNGKDMVLPCQPRVDLVREIIEEAEAKVIVFVPYTAALLHLVKELAKDFSVEAIYGDVTKNQRDRIFGNFQKRRDPRVLVADARTMSHGLNLTAANTIVWYAPTTSNETYLQANERIPRPGQKLNTLIVHIESTPVEQKMYDRLRKRGSMQGALLEMLKESR